MPKMKTRQSFAKRVRISKKKRFIVRHAGQDHFNARESSRTTVKKRSDQAFPKTQGRNIRRMVPYYKKS